MHPEPSAGPRIRRSTIVFLALGVLALVASSAVATPRQATSAPPSSAFIARADNPVDALAAAAIAGRMGAPVFLSDQAVLSEEARRGLVAAAPDLVVLAGGTAALSAAVEQQVAQAVPAAEVRRVAGESRTHTAENLAALIREFDAAWLPAGAAAGFVPTHPELVEVNLATAAYQDLDAAIDDGWDIVFTPDPDDPRSSCFDNAELGGMGVHYVNAGLLDDALDASQPEALVYEVTPDGLELAGVEYVVPGDAWTAEAPPSVLGRDLHFNEALGLWALHAWVWKDNPAGMFASYNAKVRLCPE